jgi:hypothetical protein|tara:strand:- start:469 stop:675 length:207 start_codon:yes stop_codon:yes gene_type:complete
MTYIWNRAERVDPKLMPEVVENAFNKWTKEQLKNFNELSDERKTQVTFTIAKQFGKKNYALTQLGYYK